jgi:hypothetical protein
MKPPTAMTKPVPPGEGIGVGLTIGGDIAISHAEGHIVFTPAQAMELGRHLQQLAASAALPVIDIGPARKPRAAAKKAAKR